MKPSKTINKTILSALVFTLPISVLVYNYTASKLVSFGHSRYASLMLVFLFVYALYIIFHNRKSLSFREVKYVLLFFFLTLPAYFISAFNGVESYFRYFTLISFVPIGFMSGLSWGGLFDKANIKNNDILISILLVPVLVATLMIVNSNFIYNDDLSRDYVFGIIIFLPLVLYYRNSFLPALFIIIASVICVISSKRTGVLCVASIIPFLLLIKVSTKKANTTLITTLIVFSVLIFFAFKLLPDISPQIENSIERLENMNDDSNGNRIIMYEKTVDSIRQSDLISQLFGHGCLATVSLFGNPTHNDWLEIAYDYGLIPLFCFVCFFFSLVLRMFKMFKRDMQASLILLSTLIVFLITTMGNCMFTNPIAVFIIMFTLGFALSNLRFRFSSK